MIVLVMGQIGSGKSVQSQMLAKEFAGHHLGMGQLLRDHYADNPALSSGVLVDHDLATEAVEKYLNKHASSLVFIDGFPRNLQQMQWLDNYIKNHETQELLAVVSLDTSDQEINKRLLARGRQDDTPELIEVRKRVYIDEVVPIVEQYRERDIVLEIDGDQTIQEVDAAIIKQLKPIIEG